METGLPRGRATIADWCRRIENEAELAVDFRVSMDFRCVLVAATVLAVAGISLFYMF